MAEAGIRPFLQGGTVVLTEWFVLVRVLVVKRRVTQGSTEGGLIEGLLQSG